MDGKFTRGECDVVYHPLEKNSELDDADDAVVWYGLCRKHSNVIRGGDTATVTDEDE